MSKPSRSANSLPRPIRRMSRLSAIWQAAITSWAVREASRQVRRGDLPDTASGMRYSRSWSLPGNSSKARNVRSRASQNTIDVCKTAIAATDDWDSNAASAGGKTAPRFLFQRSRLLARQWRHADAEQAAAKLRELEPKKGGNLYLAACGYASACRRRHPRHRRIEQTAERQEDIEPGNRLPGRTPWRRASSNFDRLRKDSNLLALRELPEFQALFPAEKKQSAAKPPPDKEASGSEK